MNQLKDINKHILSVLPGGDILFIIPPLAVREFAILGPHILQSLAIEMGFKADILYANMLLASIVGGETYDKISDLPYNHRWMKLGERLFARSAHGLPPLGKLPEPVRKETMGNTGEGELYEKISTQSKDYDLDDLLKLEETCASFIDEVVRAVASLDYKIVGCTARSEQNNSSVAILNGIKKIRPETITLMGGVNCEGEMAEGIASLSPHIDYVFSGESEESLRRFLTDFSESSLPSGRVITGDPIRELDAIPLPIYDGFFKQIKQFAGENTPKQMVICYETSRGCWKGHKKRCYFCGNNDNQSIAYRHKSEDQVIKDLETLNRLYSPTGILMTDNIVPPSYYKNLFPRLSGKKMFHPMWYQENTNLKIKDLVNLKNAHIYTVVFGIEALSTGLLKLMNKRVSGRQNIILLRNARSVGLYIQWFMLWGFPGDEIGRYRETLELLPLIRHLQPPLEFLHLILVRFSSFHENPEFHKITRLRPMEVHEQIYPDSADVSKLAYEFTGEYPCEAHEHPEIIRALSREVEKWIASWQNASLTMIPVGGRYIIRDNRGIEDLPINHILDGSRAEEVMKCREYTGSEQQKWAVENKLAVEVDSWYVPLVTASPELLVQFGNQ
jgi:ribosomal peptide maturation radical SAM protein 1